MPMRGELRIPARPSTELRAALARACSRVHADINDRDLITIFYCSEAGIVIAACFIHSFPYLRDIVALLWK
jgi:hypothetical protein